MLDVKYVTFREPVLGLLSPDFVYVYINRIETNYPVCRLYHYATWSEFNKIFDLLDISAEYPCQFSKYFCLAKYSGHFEFLNFLQKLQNTKMLIS